MYLVSNQNSLIETEQLELWEQEHDIILPAAYSAFLQQYGQGTYCGLLHVEQPDAQQLNGFAQYELWEHDERSPITAPQLEECIVIASTIDGDMIALHREVEGGIWLPRHATTIERLDWGTFSWQEFMDHELGKRYDPGYQLLREKAYFEPLNESKQYHQLLLNKGKSKKGQTGQGVQPTGLSEKNASVASASAGGVYLVNDPGADMEYAGAASDAPVAPSTPSPTYREPLRLRLKEIADRIALQWPPNLRVETEHSGQLFYHSVGGYIRFNYAYAAEVLFVHEEQAASSSEDDLAQSLLQALHDAGIS
ncbi:SMI1/KNR4 family protein [Paenibacillus kandeliae]|uniref:SMI1/KNR4 family protein n=1 Tax=Paenibacillus kandeliae TaxID=3231269 RepID=UPI003457E3F6